MSEAFQQSPNPVIPSKPILKWPGGKGKLLKHLLPLVPEFDGFYHEPFFGGGALYFALASQGRIKHGFLGDVSPLLLRTYHAVRDNPEAVIAHLEQRENTPEHYYAVRSTLNAALDNFEAIDSSLAAAYVIYLNKTCFNGLFRVNKKGKFNAAYGKYKNPKFLDRTAIMNAATAFQIADLRLESFEAVLRCAQPGCFVYLDPPYIPRSADSDFTEYTSDGFGLHHHQMLAQIFTALAFKGVKAIVSNSDVPLVRELYRAHRMIEIEANRVINVVATKRGKVPELIICNW